MLKCIVNWGRLFLSPFFRIIYCLPAGCLALNSQVLKEKMATPPPAWMMRQIQSDLAPFRETGITTQMIDAYWRESKNPRDALLVRLKTINGIVSIQSDAFKDEPVRLKAIQGAFEQLNSIKALPNLDLLITLHDGYSGDLPILAFAKNKQTPGGILIPDFEALSGYDRLTKNILSANIKYPWEFKQNSAFWRGSSTGGVYNLKNWESFPRAKLVQLSLRNPRDLNARFTSLVQMDKETKYLLSARGFLGMFAPPSEHLPYKYLVEVDGNSCSYSRVYWELLSNSVVLKQVSDNIQWYYGALVPGEHFIPLATDLSDFLMKLNWARANEGECKRIAESATEFAKSELSPESTYLYLQLLLEEYAKIYVPS